MSMEAIALTVAFSVVGGVLGWLVLPKATDKMLKYKYKQLTDYWNSQLEAMYKYREEHDGLLPSKKAKGADGALRIWIDDQFLQASLGNLTKEQFAKLREAGFKF